MHDLPHVFAIFEDREAWIQEHHHQLGACPYERFLEEEQSLINIAQTVREAGLEISLYKYSSPTFRKWLDTLYNRRDAIVWNLTDGYDHYIGSNIPALARLLRRPFIGSGSYSQMLCQNKYHTKAIADASGIPTARGIVVDRFSKALNDQISSLPDVCFVKPASLDNGIGDTIAFPIRLIRVPAEQSINFSNQHVCHKPINMAFSKNENDARYS